MSDESNSRPTRTVPPPTNDEVVVAQANNLPARAERVATPVAKTVSEREEAPEAELPADGPGAVIGAIAAIMSEIKPVEKLGWNDFHKYAHVRMQDLSASLTPLMGKHGIVVFQTEEGRELFDDGNAVAVRYRFTVVHKSGAIWPQRPLQTGVSSCRNRGGFDDKALNKCHTAARKYFLLSLFQIASEDDTDADGDGRPPSSRTQQQRPQRRAVPAPDGKVAPHAIPIINGETPQAWGERFLKFIAKATSKADIDGWYGENEVAFEKMKERFPNDYNAILDGMDAKEAELLAPKKEVAKPVEKPADKPPADSGDIPANLDRRKKKEADDLGTVTTTSEWLAGLEGAFSGCEDTVSLAEERDRLMTPEKEHVSKKAWESAGKLFAEHFARITAGDE